MDSSSEHTHESDSSEEQAEQQDAANQEEQSLPNGDEAKEEQVEEEKKPSTEEEKTTSAAAGDAGKLFIGGLSWETTTDKLTKHFAKYGEIIDSVVMKDRVTGHPRGFGFVTYSDASVLDTVINEQHILDGRTVDVKRTVPREDNSKGPKTKKIFVGGIPTSVSEDDVKKYFEQFGTVVGHQIMKDHASGRSRGFGFVIFENEQVVDDIIAQGKSHELGGKQVEIKKAEPKRPDSEPASRMPPVGRGGPAMRSGGYGGYMGGDYGPYAEGMYGSGYRSGAGYGARMGAYGGGAYGYGNFGPYDAMGGGFGGGMIGGYGEGERYGPMGYGGYNSGGYGPSGGRRYGGSASNGRFYPYGRN